MWEFITESVMFKNIYFYYKTEHAYKTERKGYWQLFDTCDNSTEY